MCLCFENDGKWLLLMLKSAKSIVFSDGWEGKNIRLCAAFGGGDAVGGEHPFVSHFKTLFSEIFQNPL